MVDDKIDRVELTADALVVHLADKRVFAISLWSIPRLANATVGQRYQWRVSEDGRRIEWTMLGLKITVDELLTRAAKDLADR